MIVVHRVHVDESVRKMLTLYINVKTLYKLNMLIMRIQQSPQNSLL